ncbi:spindle pole body formation-associated protein-domain-containing protein [Massariosphaeria phaeospora]|uniref:Spindle pole body formation-associated protein-domain-containing protein n=1 Tax=Massariosphaeria phaeospora TaxID=100035 RepID=A0A7C8I1J0_9PLEO|nr:spindle pole body formation-associated protein-domain-containing protein [Massariosphaeria phaeospora]
MFSWLTGPRITNVIEDLQPDGAYDTTFVEPPETPAHQFAVKAFKQVLFGTPAPDETDPSKKQDKTNKLDMANGKTTELPPPEETAPPLSPSKQPGGILMTPGTAGKGRKTVTFGAQVVDNEGKRANPGKSGVPNDCPGKFPSPWTPGTELKLGADSDNKPRSKLTAALLDARTTTQNKSGQKPKARDDSDITIDLGTPRSESGKYWKEQYESYAERSEKEMKKLVAKQQLAKNYAMKKDDEMTELTTRLAEERKRFKSRERDLEQQNNDYKERLRQAMAEKIAVGVEITALRNRIQTFELSTVAPSCEVQITGQAFQIHEDSSKDVSRLQSGRENVNDAIQIDESAYVPPTGKENSPPKSRHRRRQTLLDSSRLPVPNPALSNLRTEFTQGSSILGTAPRAPRHQKYTAQSTLTTGPSLESHSNPHLSERKPSPNKDNLPPKSPVTAFPSSPLPVPSPDPWMGYNNDDSPLPQMDKMAMPISTGASYGRPLKSSRPDRQSTHRAPKPEPLASKPDASKTRTRTLQKPVSQAANVENSKFATQDTQKSAKPAHDTDDVKEAKADHVKPSDAALRQPAPADPMFDVSKTAQHHADANSLVKKDRVDLAVDRKEQAKRRLEERKLRKLTKSG